MKRLTMLLSAALVAAALTVPGVALADGAAQEKGPLQAVSAEVLSVQAVTADYSWYDSSATSYTLSNANQLLGFANLVNGADGKSATTFQGKAVSLKAGGTYNLQAAEWTPIGDASNQFRGAFNGNGATVDNFKVSGSRAAYLGLFGYVGANGSVNGITVGTNATVTVSRDASSADVVHHVAGVVGFCGGTMADCKNGARVTVSSAVKQTSDNPQPIYAVGGVAGECIFNMSGCTNLAAISVSQTSDPVGEIDDSGLVHFVGGVVGILGDSARVGTSSAPVAADATKHGSLSNCKNEGKVSVDTPSEAGLDRFGSTAYARSVCVGGVAGYSQGSVSNCTNGLATGATASDVGYVRAEHATSAGGIVGSLRGLIGSDNPTTRSNQDDGMAGGGKDVLLVSNCTNYGDVYALNAAGGIAGYAGTYTTIKNCINAQRTNGGSFVVATRWNKPAPAGIVGSTCGDLAYCANFATVMSGTWDDESQRTYKTAAGYYAAGIAGMLSYYSEVNATTQATVRTSPLPEVYGCYNAGSILAVSGMRQRGIVGENEGYVHHCALLSGTVENDNIAYGGNASDSEASGSVGDCKVYTVAELKGTAPIALMNEPCTAADWSGGYYWIQSNGTDQAQNFGYPVLSTTNTFSRTDISGASASLKANALYNGGTDGNEAVPDIGASLGSTALTRNVDFYIVPQAGAVEVTANKPYSASIVGVGKYAGTKAGIAYGIDKGFLSECIVTVNGATFNYEAQYPQKSDITVKTKTGVVIDPVEYVIESVKDASGNVTTTPTNKGNYTVTVKVTDGSAHFDTSQNNTASGSYRISPASIMSAIDYSKVTISFNGETYPWVSSSDEADVDHPKTTLPYTGEPVKPTVSGLTYNGHELVEGVDYRIVYGNANPENGDTVSHDASNVGVRYGTSVGCVTVRYVTNSNFTNYENMFFNITDSREEPNPTAMHRLYNPYSGEHFYTANESERDDVVAAGWTYEGVGWNAPSSSWKPVYRVYNSYAGEHHYTLDAAERDALVEAGWTDEGTGWYSDEDEATPLYREYNPNEFSCNHNYTADKEEHDYLVSIGWVDEGIAWYGMAS